MPADRDAAADGTADCLRGRLCRERLDLGSKSERLAVLLVVDDGDRVVLRQALINLVDNAIKYTPEGGQIVVRVAGSPNGPTVDVIDSGPGVAPDAASRIFNRFERGGRQRSDERGGSGLGLAIAKWAIEVSGGRLTLEAASGRGSTFRIALPSADAGTVRL